MKIPKWQLCRELYKAKRFRDLIGTPYPKQELALELLTNDEPMQLLYGGAAGGGKSFLAWTWLVFQAMCYPQTTWVFAREQLNDARIYGLQTFHKVCETYGIDKDYFTINGKDNFVKAKNGSIIYLKELKKKPSDTEFTGLGSTEFTGGVIEEAGQIVFDAYETLWTRIGRQHNQRYGLAKKLLVLANPTKNFLYHSFYIPHEKRALQPPKYYIQAKVEDNPFQSQEYIESLRNLTDPIRRARLYEGNWHYHNDETTLFEFDKIQAVFNNTYANDGDKYISVDRAGQGEDKTVLMVANGNKVIHVHEEAKSTHDSIVKLIKQKCHEYKVPMYNVVVDAGGLSDVHHTLGCKGFISGAKATNSLYPNLKTECAYILADLVRNGRLSIDCSPQHQETIKNELDAVRKAKVDSDDGKLYINKKEEQKKIVNNSSPDFADTLIMLMYFKTNLQPMLYYWSGENIKDIEPINPFVVVNANEDYGYYILLVQKQDTLQYLESKMFVNVDELITYIGTKDVLFYGGSGTRREKYKVKTSQRAFLKMKLGRDVQNQMITNELKAIDMVNELHKKGLVKVSPNCTEYIQDKMNTKKAEDGTKERKVCGFYTDCEDAVVSLLY